MNRARLLSSNAFLLGLLLLSSACTTTSPTLVPTPTLSPTIEALATQLFWIAVEVAGIEPNTPFEEAKVRLGLQLFESLNQKASELEKLGINYQTHSPYCINAIAGSSAILDLYDSQSSVEAAPNANRAIMAIRGMDEDIEIARTALFLDETKETKDFSQEELLRSLEICNLVIKEHSQKGDGQAQAKPAGERDLLPTYEYRDHARPYMTDLQEAIQVGFRGVKLEGKQPLEEEIDLLNNEIAYIQLRRSRFEAIDTPTEFQALRDLILESFGSSGQSLDMLRTTFQRSLSPAPSKRAWAERLAEDMSVARELLYVAVDDFGKVVNEDKNLIDQYEEQLKALGAIK